MCCFSGPVKNVGGTRIFARVARGALRQELAYSMTFSASESLAMILPLPVLPGAGDDARPQLTVHKVGHLEASFVPSTSDFDRLDPRFRLPPALWDQLPVQRTYGFVVVKLAASASSQNVHPIAFDFALVGMLSAPPPAQAGKLADAAKLGKPYFRIKSFEKSGKLVE